MEHNKPIPPEHFGRYGNLFAGTMLKWVDEDAWIAASLDYPECKFVTIDTEAACSAPGQPSSVSATRAPSSRSPNSEDRSSTVASHSNSA